MKMYGTSTTLREPIKRSMRWSTEIMRTIGMANHSLIHAPLRTRARSFRKTRHHKGSLSTDFRLKDNNMGGSASLIGSRRKAKNQFRTSRPTAHIQIVKMSKTLASQAAVTSTTLHSAMISSKTVLNKCRARTATNRVSHLCLSRASNSGWATTWTWT